MSATIADLTIRGLAGWGEPLQIAVEHADHDRATRWAAGVESFAWCPIVEGRLLRFVVRRGADVSDGLRLCKAIRRRPGFEFWTDELSYAAVPLEHVIGHRQLTDAYPAGEVSVSAEGTAP